MLTFEKLNIQIGNNQLFSDLSFTAITGSLIIVRGSNGSGKTSFLRTICGLENILQGSISWNGVSIYEDIDSFRSNLVYISDKNSFDDHLTVGENIIFWAKYRGDEELILPAIRFFQLEELLDIKFKDLSSGMKKKAELSRLLLSKSSLWLIDEGDSFLDKKTRHKFIDLIKVRAKEGGVIIMATHNESDLEFANYINLEDFKSRNA